MRAVGAAEPRLRRPVNRDCRHADRSGTRSNNSENPREMRSSSRGLGLPPAAEDEAAEGDAEPERPDGEAADRHDLAPGREALPAAESLLLLGRQRLAAPLLAHRASGAESEVEVVEDLGGIVCHA